MIAQVSAAGTILARNPAYEQLRPCAEKKSLKRGDLKKAEVSCFVMENPVEKC
jgi:hypothetical protein